MKTLQFPLIYDVDNLIWREKSVKTQRFCCILILTNFVFKTKSVKTQRFDRILMLTIQFHGKNPWKRNNTVVLCCWQFWFHEKKLRSIFAVNLNCFDCWKMSYSKAFPDWIFLVARYFDWNWKFLTLFDKLGLVMLSLEINSKKQNQHAEKSRNLEKSESGNILDIRDLKSK